MRTIKQIFIVSVLTVLPAMTNAQSVRVFEHLSVGLEVGTTGGGLEISTSINSFINLRTGFSTLPFSYNANFDVDYDDGVIREFQRDYGSELAANNIDISHLYGVQARLKAKTGLYNGKLLVDIHPFRSSSFHVTAGLYVGKKRLVTVDGNLPEETWRTTTEVNDLIRRNPSWGLSTVETGVVIGDNTIMPDENGHVDAGIRMNSVKPYLGIDFGRSIPNRPWGFQFDLGCMFHGKPKIVSKTSGVTDVLNSELDSSGFVDVMNKIKVYPVMSFKVTRKIF
ncbi:MAG: hypothetical protein LIO79_09535 [Rikenellaceae bacterium]|nr:hypothetical protein [Rikenellaceae bacterium]